jgi:hypothetical protein
MTRIWVGFLAISDTHGRLGVINQNVTVTPRAAVPPQILPRSRLSERVFLGCFPGPAFLARFPGA